MGFVKWKTHFSQITHSRMGSNEPFHPNAYCTFNPVQSQNGVNVYKQTGSIFNKIQLRTSSSLLDVYLFSLNDLMALKKKIKNQRRRIHNGLKNLIFNFFLPFFFIFSLNQVVFSCILMYQIFHTHTYQDHLFVSSISLENANTIGAKT